MKLENFVAEEYLTVIHIKLIELMANETKMDLEPFRITLEWKSVCAHHNFSFARSDTSTFLKGLR